MTEAEEAAIIALRRHTLLPLDDCLYALQPSIPHLTRSALHRCLPRHGISRPPDVDGDKPGRQNFKRYPIGFIPIDIAEVQTAEGKLFPCVAIDRTGEVAVAQFLEKANRRTAWEFLEHLLDDVPCRIHTVLTKNGIQFAGQPRIRNRPHSRQMRFDMICEGQPRFATGSRPVAGGIEYRPTRPSPPWGSEGQKTIRGIVFPRDGQVERMNRTIEEATVRRYHHDSHGQLRAHLGGLPGRLQCRAPPENAGRPHAI